MTKFAILKYNAQILLERCNPKCLASLVRIADNFLIDLKNLTYLCKYSMYYSNFHMVMIMKKVLT